LGQQEAASNNALGTWTGRPDKTPVAVETLFNQALAGQPQNNYGEDVARLLAKGQSTPQTVAAGAEALPQVQRTVTAPAAPRAPRRLIYNPETGQLE
jgi:hypothetical protein